MANAKKDMTILNELKSYYIFRKTSLLLFISYFLNFLFLVLFL